MAFSDSALLNARVTKIERPTRAGVGGKITGRATVFLAPAEGAYNALYEPRNDLVRAVDGREVVRTGLLYVDRVLDPAEPFLDVRVGDLVAWTDFNTAAHADAEVATAELCAFPGSSIDHWELGFQGA